MACNKPEVKDREIETAFKILTQEIEMLSTTAESIPLILESVLSNENPVNPSTENALELNAPLAKKIKSASDNIIGIRNNLSRVIERIEL